MADIQSEKSWLEKNIKWIVFVYLGFIALYTLFPLFTNMENPSLSFNELGDFLAGTFAPLAFLFLVLAFSQNNRSLDKQSEVLTQQAESLDKQSEALTQQAQALKLQATSLDTQIEELKVANNTYQQQVDEMKKSVEAQQNMFNLAETQYREMLDEKITSSRPKLIFIETQLEDFSNSNFSLFDYRIRTSLEIKNMKVYNFSMESDFWSIVLLQNTEGSLNYKKKINLNSLEINQQNNLMLYAKKQNRIAFEQEHLIHIKYSDENGKNYHEIFSLELTDSQTVQWNKTSSSS